MDDFPLEDLDEFFFTLWCLLDMEDDEIVLLFNQFHFFMVVNQICNVIPVISWGFVDCEEDVAAPLVEDYVWLTTNYSSNNYNITHFYSTPVASFL